MSLARPPLFLPSAPQEPRGQTSCPGSAPRFPVISNLCPLGTREEVVGWWGRLPMSPKQVASHL